MTRVRLGSLAWARVTAGRLSPAEAVVFAWSAWRSELARWPRSLRHRLSPRSARALEAPPHLPDTPCVREALALAMASCSPWVIEHAWRTSFWAHLLGAGDGRTFDSELLHVAAMLHDVALEETRSAGCGCFAVDGALRAEAFARERGWSEERSSALGDAIALHMNPLVPTASAPEAHLLQAGAALDVLGARLGELDRRVVASVLSRHPRGEFGARFAQAMRNEALRTPGSRTALLVALGFTGRIERSPWRDGGR
jgi:hypothetical protein